MSGILPTIGIQCRVMDLGFTYSPVVSAEVELVELYSQAASSLCYSSLWLVTLGSGLLAQAWSLSPTSVIAGITEPSWRQLWLSLSFIQNDQPACSWLQGHSGHTVLNSNSLLVIPSTSLLIPYYDYFFLITIFNLSSISHIFLYLYNIFLYLHIFLNSNQFSFLKKGMKNTHILIKVSLSLHSLYPLNKITFAVPFMLHIIHSSILLPIGMGCYSKFWNKKLFCWTHLIMWRFDYEVTGLTWVDHILFPKVLWHSPC